MISFVLASVLATQPLMATGNDAGVWFVRDTEPGMIGPQHELCHQIDQDTFQVVLPLAKRPIALAVHGQILWFVGDSDPPILYRARLVENQATGDLRTVPRGRATAVTPLEIQGLVRDLVFMQDEPVFVIDNGGVQCFDMKGLAITSKLTGDDAHVAMQGSNLIGAVSNMNIVTLYTLKDGSWQAGEKHEINGELQDLVVHDGWPLLITTHDDLVEIIGLQQGKQMKISSFSKPSGRWSVVDSDGLHVLGVERNGTSTAFSIGWPSGKRTEPVDLSEQYGSVEAIELTMMIVTTVIFFVVLMLILSRKPKNIKKNDG